MCLCVGGDRAAAVCRVCCVFIALPLLYCFTASLLVLVALGAVCVHVAVPCMHEALSLCMHEALSLCVHARRP